MRLDFQNVKFKNFMSFGSKWQEITFNTGINIILGKNGTGKSSCMETIPFALFGRTHKEIKKDDLINWKNRKGTEVQLTFTKGNDIYRIIRAIKPNNFEIYKNDELQPKPSHTKEYQAQLEDIISTNFQTFMSLIHCNINSSQPIFGMSKPDKRKFIERVFNLTLYSDINDKANKKITIINNRIYEDNLQISSNTKSIKESEERIKQLSGKIKSLKSSVPLLNDAKERSNDITLMESKQFENLKSEMKDLERSLEDVDIIFRKCEDKKIYIASNMRNMKKNIPSEVIKPEEDVSLEEAKKLLEQLIERQNNITEKHNKLEYKRAHTETEINKLSNRKKNLADGGNCPTCGQNVGPEIVEHIDKELKNLDEKLTNIDISIHYAREELSNLNSLREEAYKTVQNIESYNRYESEKKEIVKDIKRWKTAYEKLVSYIGRLVGARTDIEKDYSLKRESVDNEMLKRNKAEKIDAEIKALEDKIEVEESTKKEFQALVSTDKQNINRLQKENIKLGEKIEKFNNMKDYMEYIKVMCKDDNIKAYAIKSIIPILTKNTNYYLSEIGHPFYVKLNNWLDPIIKGPGISSGSYNSLSSGESKAVDMSLQNAFFDIARIQSGTFPDITILDELLDSSVDSDSLDVLLQIVKNKQQADKSKVYIISHRESITDIEADNMLMLYKEGGYSKIKMFDDIIKSKSHKESKSKEIKEKFDKLKENKQEEK